ncbi:MAG: hypothetical protein ACLR76_04575 [Alistipes sp.]
MSGGLDSTLALLVTVRAFDKLDPAPPHHRHHDARIRTTGRTYGNALNLMRTLGVDMREIGIKAACEQHFNDIGLDPSDRSTTYENAQARERTQILMDFANRTGGLVVGTGDLSELALGWATYNGDHMSMYGVNCGIPKTLVRYLVRWVADNGTEADARPYLLDIIDTPISPELLPAGAGDEIAQRTEDTVGPYELHDFFLYHFIRYGFSPAKLFFMACRAFDGRYDRATVKSGSSHSCGVSFPSNSNGPPCPAARRSARSASPAATGACQATPRPSSGSTRRKRFPYDAAPEQTLRSRRLSRSCEPLFSRTYQAESKFSDTAHKALTIKTKLFPPIESSLTKWNIFRKNLENQISSYICITKNKGPGKVVSASGNRKDGDLVER